MSNNKQNEIQGNNNIDSKGELFVVGIGPGGREHRTFLAEKTILDADVVVGYTTYLNLVKDLTENKETFGSGMRAEIERVKKAVEFALSGKKVALISSGDSGVYGMAGLAVELCKNHPEIEVTPIPGITAANTAANALGAPLMLDYAVVSLSDLMVPWDQITKRLALIAEAEMPVALYNPRSKKRVDHLDIAIDIFLKTRKPETICGVVTDAGREGEHVVITTLGELKNCDVGMRSLVLIGSEGSVVINGKFIMPRGYAV